MPYATQSKFVNADYDSDFRLKFLQWSMNERCEPHTSWAQHWLVRHPPSRSECSKQIHQSEDSWLSSAFFGGVTICNNYTTESETDTDTDTDTFTDSETDTDTDTDKWCSRHYYHSTRLRIFDFPSDSNFHLSIIYHLSFTIDLSIIVYQIPGYR